MTPADRIAIFVFIVALLGGGLVMFGMRLLRKSSKEKVAERLGELTRSIPLELETRSIAEIARAQREARRRRLRQSMGVLGTYLARMEALGGRRGIYTAMVAIPALFVFALLVNWLLLPFPLWVETTLAIAVPALTAYTIHSMLVDRFKNAFLAQMPDILDTITRASQAGVPVVGAIRNVGDIYDWPAGPEFKRIGQNLQLGNDMTAVLDEAELRIRIPDFSFLCVCLLLQRETGGSLSGTLSNLAGVIRERRDLRLKARALTAEARIMSKVIAAIPFVMIAMMWFMSPDYITVLFNTAQGRFILGLAGVLLSLGLFLVNRMAKLRV